MVRAVENIYYKFTIDEEQRMIIQQWNSIPEHKRPKEYIFIVDLEGHFVYAYKPLTRPYST